MKKGIIICIAASLLAFTLTFLGMSMLNRMVTKEFENKSVEDLYKKTISVNKTKVWLPETEETVVVDPPLLSLELEQDEPQQQKLPAIEIVPEPTELNAASAVCEFVKMIRVRDQVYISTNTAVNILRCGVMDGEIDSTVAPGVLPEENNQSNFGTGYGYQIRSSDIVDVYMDGEWIMFTPADRQIYIDLEWEQNE